MNLCPRLVLLAAFGGLALSAHAQAPAPPIIRPLA